MMRKIIILLMVCLLLLNSTAAFATDTDDIMVVGDLLLARPLGIVATVIGSAVYFVSLPFTIPSGSVQHTGATMVGEPFNFTFKRPLGDFRYYRANRPVERQQEEQKQSDNPAGE
jgi:hypothetical protein